MFFNRTYVVFFVEVWRLPFCIVLFFSLFWTYSILFQYFQTEKAFALFNEMKEKGMKGKCRKCGGECRNTVMCTLWMILCVIRSTLWYAGKITWYQEESWLWHWKRNKVTNITLYGSRWKFEIELLFILVYGSPIFILAFMNLTIFLVLFCL